MGVAALMCWPAALSEISAAHAAGRKIPGGVVFMVRFLPPD